MRDAENKICKTKIRESQHPVFSDKVEKHTEFKNSLNNLLPFSVSQECLDSALRTVVLVKKEAFCNCHDKELSSFLCILGFSSVVGKCIQTYFPDSERCVID